MSLNTREYTGLQYSHTNEDLRAITEGLHPSPQDSVLVVVGSGDQAFALLEFAKVTAVDCNPYQIVFVNKRADFLRNGDFGTFLNADVRGSADGYFSSLFGCTFYPDIEKEIVKKRNDYFSEVGRLRKIQGNLCNLAVRKQSVFAAAEDQGFTCIYLSNIHPERRDLEYMAKNLPLGALIYMADFQFRDIKINYDLDPPTIWFWIEVGAQ